MKNDIGAAACGTGKFGNELRADSIQEKLAAEWTGLHERPADARMQPSARGLLRPNGRKFKMKNEELKMRLGSQLAKEPHTSGLADARMQPSARGGAAGCCGSLRNRKFRIQNSRFKIANRDAACGGASDTMELRASAAPKLRPARPFQGRNSTFRIQYETHADACGIESDRSAGLPALRPAPVFTSRNTSPTAPWRR